MLAFSKTKIAALLLLAFGLAFWFALKPFDHSEAIQLLTLQHPLNPGQLFPVAELRPLDYSSCSTEEQERLRQTFITFPDRAILYGRQTCRPLIPGDPILYRDIQPLDPSAITRPDELALAVHLALIPSLSTLLSPGDLVDFLAVSTDAGPFGLRSSVPPAPREESIERIGPFRVLSVGKPLNPSPIPTPHLQSFNPSAAAAHPSAILVAIKKSPSGTGFDPLAEKLIKLLATQNANPDQNPPGILLVLHAPSLPPPEESPSPVAASSELPVQREGSPKSAGQPDPTTRQDEDDLSTYERLTPP